MKTVEIRVVGRVQGVGFRAFVERTANAMGVQGEVWNTFSGEVGVLASGTEEAIDNLVEALRRGPGRVDRVSLAEATAPTGLQGFRVVESKP